jgi:hypothetical protein
MLYFTPYRAKVSPMPPSMVFAAAMSALPPTGTL